MSAPHPFELKAKVRVANAPNSPELTIEALYIQGESETPMAQCSWPAGKAIGRIHFALSELIPNERTDK